MSRSPLSGRLPRILLEFSFRVQPLWSPRQTVVRRIVADSVRHRHAEADALCWHLVRRRYHPSGPSSFAARKAPDNLEAPVHLVDKRQSEISRSNVRLGGNTLFAPSESVMPRLFPQLNVAILQARSKCTRRALCVRDVS
jgi:hypothetical protein